MNMLGLLILLATVAVVIVIAKIARGKLGCLWVLCIPIVLVGLFFIRGTTFSDGRTANCLSNLKQIGLSLHMYAQDYNDKFPDRLIDLYPKYVDNLKLFICVSKHPDRNYYDLHKFEDPFADPFYQKMISGESMDYQYTKGLNEESPPTIILAQDKEGNHSQGVVNALYLDGHVETKNVPPWYRNFYFHVPLPD
jgi:prepilin-type processing-associated H-X9-DG protein